jgi:hypothetical protein
LLRRQWAIISSCEHPEFPSLTLPVSERATEHKDGAMTPFSIVHAGDVVLVWSQEAFVRIEMTGVAEGNAALGDRIRIHLLRPSTVSAEGANFAQNVGPLFGIVRGPHEVEIRQ